MTKDEHDQMHSPAAVGVEMGQERRVGCTLAHAWQEESLSDGAIKINVSPATAMHAVALGDVGGEVLGAPGEQVARVVSRRSVSCMAAHRGHLVGDFHEFATKFVFFHLSRRGCVLFSPRVPCALA